ncbi:MAG: hypothetical protein ABIX37_10765 [Gammaproteobacteria bacterium]
MSYQFRQFHITDHMLESLDQYVEQGVPPGGFLYAVLSNDFKGAAGRADDENLANLPAYAAWLYNEAPSPCQGSKEAVEKWLAMHAQRREAA